MSALARTLEREAHALAANDNCFKNRRWTRTKYGYDSVNRLTSYFNGTATGTYAYDANGNRLSYSLSGTTTYHYTASTNKLSSLTGTTTQSFTNNSDGSMTGDGTHTWAYDQRGFAISETTSGTTISYGINGFGQRVSKSGTGVPNGGTNEFVYDEQGHLIGEYGSTGTIVNETEWIPNTPVSVYSRGNGINAWTMDARPVAMLTGAAGGTINPITADWLNTPHIIANSTKGIIWIWQHDPNGTNAPNGNPYGLGATTYNPRFMGQYNDFESGLNHNGARIYGPSWGRYIQSDPLGLGAGRSGSYSTFPYVASDPLTRIDPWGTDYNNYGGRHPFDTSKWTMVTTVDDDQNTSATFLSNGPIAINAFSLAGPLPTNQFMFYVTARPYNANGTPETFCSTSTFTSPVNYSSGFTGGPTPNQFIIYPNFSAPLYEWTVTIPGQEETQDNHDFERLDIYK
jgi:RHS repeat-associated protein